MIEQFMLGLAILIVAIYWIFKVVGLIFDGIGGIAVARDARDGYMKYHKGEHLVLQSIEEDYDNSIFISKLKLFFGVIFIIIPFFLLTKLL